MRVHDAHFAPIPTLALLKKNCEIDRVAPHCMLKKLSKSTMTESELTRKCLFLLRWWNCSGAADLLCFTIDYFQYPRSNTCNVALSNCSPSGRTPPPRESRSKSSDFKSTDPSLFFVEAHFTVSRSPNYYLRMSRGVMRSLLRTGMKLSTSASKSEGGLSQAFRCTEFFLRLSLGIRCWSFKTERSKSSGIFSQISGTRC